MVVRWCSFVELSCVNMATAVTLGKCKVTRPNYIDLLTVQSLGNNVFVGENVRLCSHVYSRSHSIFSASSCERWCVKGRRFRHSAVLQINQQAHLLRAPLSLN